MLLNCTAISCSLAGRQKIFGGDRQCQQNTKLMDQSTRLVDIL